MTQAGGFEEPDWAGPLDLQARLEAAPAHAEVKGMFFEQIRETMGDRAEDVDPGGHYNSFRDYPLSKWLNLVHDAAVGAFGDFPPKRAVFELARPTFERFKNSLLGRVIFTGEGFEQSLRATSKAYRRTSASARCEVALMGAHRAVLELRECWDFHEWHIGIFHGAMQTFGKHGDVRVRTISLESLDLELSW